MRQSCYPFDMNQHRIYRLTRLSVIDVCGVDAATIVHNVTTNEVKKLSEGEGRETFITDVRGKTLGHVFLYRESSLLRLIGAPGQSQRIAEHLDRYTIREDAVSAIRDNDLTVFACPPDVSSMLEAADSAPTEGSRNSIAMLTMTIDGVSVLIYRTRWLGEGTCVLMTANETAEVIEKWCQTRSLLVCDEAEYQQARTVAGFPWYGVDLTDTNLPQEADRDDLTISFTKGCYLGQETVARLDALGQVQKKLVRWSIRGAVPPVDTTLTSDEKTVGRLTSIAAVDRTDQSAIAIGFARRSHFDGGATAKGIDTQSGGEFIATVLGADRGGQA